jgi:hypothetical protein
MNSELKPIILSKLQEQGRPITVTGDNWIMTSCLNPAHMDKHPSFAVNLTTGAGKCFSCGYTIGPSYWVVGKLTTEEEEELLRKAKYSELLNRFEKSSKEPLVSSTVFLPPKSRDLEEGWRGLSKETIEQYGLYICDKGAYAGRVIFPIKDISGAITAFNSRALSPEIQPKYKFSKGFDPNIIIYPEVPLNSSEVFLVEGIMDALHMRQEGFVSILNFGINYTFKHQIKISELLKKGVDTIYICLDKDEAGEKGTQKYLQSPLTEFFEVKHGRECPRLFEYYKSPFKDFAEYIENTKGGVK